MGRAPAMTAAVKLKHLVVPGVGIGRPAAFVEGDIITVVVSPKNT